MPVLSAGTLILDPHGCGQHAHTPTNLCVNTHTLNVTFVLPRHIDIRYSSDKILWENAGETKESVKWGKKPDRVGKRERGMERERVGKVEWHPGEPWNIHTSAHPSPGHKGGGCL